MSITSEEIARLANVSRSTVSRVINHYPNVPDATREKVLKVIREYDYHPNEIARALAGKASKEIGLFVREQRYEGLMESSFIHRMVSMLVRTCYENRSALSVYLVRNDQDFEDIRDSYRRKKICGGIFVGFEYETEWINSLVGDGFNMALIDVEKEGIKEGPNLAFLNFDNETAGYLATKYLIDQGRRHILHIAGDGRYSSVQREEGYKRAMREAGLEEMIRIVRADFDPAKACELMEESLRREAYDGVFVTSDRMGVHVVHMIRKQGLMVPGDIAVTGCDHIDESFSVQEVSMTSVELPLKDVVEKAVKMLLGLEEKTDLTVPVKIVIGETA